MPPQSTLSQPRLAIVPPIMRHTVLLVQSQFRGNANGLPYLRIYLFFLPLTTFPTLIPPHYFLGPVLHMVSLNMTPLFLGLAHTQMVHVREAEFPD